MKAARQIFAITGLLLLTVTPAAAADWIYTVRPGDNLWDITERYTKSMGYWKPLLDLNEVEQPREMPPGMRIRIPVRWLRLVPVSARVVSVSGEASRIRGAAGSSEPVVAGMELKLGDALETGTGGSLTVEFADGSQLLVRPESRLKMDSIRAYEGTGMVDTRTGLVKGRVESAVQPSVGPGTRFEIHTPTAVTSVRGTDLRVGSSDASATQVEVLEGRVGVSGAGRSRALTAGFGTVVRPNEPPLQPRPLLPAPELGVEPLLLDRLPFRLRWTAVEGASRYQVQIADNAEFNTLLVDAQTTQGDLPGVDLPDGEYFVRIRAVDELGLEGLDAEAKMVIDARPEPPFPVQPPPEEVVRTEEPRFVWSEPPNADGYAFQLASTAEFTDPLVSEDDLRGAAFAVAEPLAPGSYYWRIATRQGKETGPFSDPQPFTVRPPPESPELEPPEVTKTRLVLRWRAGDPGQRYEYQLARDQDFRDIVLRETVAKPEAVLEDPTTGYYFLRVRTLDPDGYAGSYGPPQRIYVPPDSYWPALAPLGILLLLIIL